MNAERLVLRLLDGRSADLDAFEAALDVRDLPLRGPRSWLLDRAGLVYTVFVGLLRAAARRPASPATRAVFYEVSAHHTKTLRVLQGLCPRRTSVTTSTSC